MPIRAKIYKILKFRSMTVAQTKLDSICHNSIMGRHVAFHEAHDSPVSSSYLLKEKKEIFESSVFLR